MTLAGGAQIMMAALTERLSSVVLYHSRSKLHDQYF